MRKSISIWYKSAVLSSCWLILLVSMKIKILSGYRFLWARVFRKTQNFIPESIGYFNPLFYFDDIFVAFLLFVVCLYSFRKGNKKINSAIYFTYFFICCFSILSSIAFYKYGVPLNLAIINQIDSLYTMRTSIDTEIMENLRLVLASLVMISFSVLVPTLMIYFKGRVLRKRLAGPEADSKTPFLVILILLLFPLFIMKSYLFGSNVLTETPVTTLAKSIILNLDTEKIGEKAKISKFNDLISISEKNQTSERGSDPLAGKRSKYNVIIIILETTNAKFFLPKGPFSQYLPHLSKLGEEGLYLPQFFTPFSRSSKAFFAILTGHYPLTDYKSIIKVVPDIEIPTIFSILKNKGYSTFAGYSGDFRYDRMADFLEDRGVDRFVDIYNNDGRYDQISWSVDDELIYDQLMDWINTLNDKVPFFALLLTMNSHHPFWTPKESLKVVEEHDQEGRYVNAIHYQDFLVGKLIDYLNRTNKLQNTIIIITGDHGAVFNFLKQEDTKASPYIIDKDTVKVPFYIYQPLIKSINIPSDIIGSHIDILPTILDMLGIETEERVQGRSIFDPKIKDRISFVYTDYYHHIVAGLTNKHYLIKDMTEDTTILSRRLDLKKNVCDSEKEICSLLLKKVEEFDKFQNQRLFRYSR